MHSERRLDRSSSLLAAIVAGLLLLAGFAETETAVAQTVPSVDYTTDIQPIFIRRCIACHGCLGSPCNVKLDSFRGADRSGFGVNPYSSHIESSPRVGMDVVETTADWRRRGFFPILDREGTQSDRQDHSLLYKMALAGHRHNQPGFSRAATMPLYAKRFDHQCPGSPEALDAYLQANPAAGMPFGLPAVSDADLGKLADWIANGAPGPTPEALRRAATVSGKAAVAEWEDFLNDLDPRNRLVARYIFDHVYQASIVLEESPGDFFRLVRSSTPAAARTALAEEQPIKVIDTPLPYDDPYAHAKVEQFSYRLQKVTTPRVQKNHFVWSLNKESLARLKALFLGRDWDKTQDMNPPWGVGNPFRIYRAIPAEARSLFLLENSEVIVGGITYGPVCLGQTATYAVKDHFWVYFLDPRYDPSVQDPKLGLETWSAMMDRSPIGDAKYADAYAKAQKKLTPEGLTVDAIWNGGGRNPNAWLTVLRHETNVSVMKGRQGGMPPSQWLVSYSGLERLYYDTVASYKYWEGDTGKLETLVFFNFLRQEMEDNFLLLLPDTDREPIRRQWAQGVFGAIGRLLVPFPDRTLPGAGAQDPSKPLLEIVDRIQARMGPAISGPVDRLNPRIKPKISLESPIDGYRRWAEAVSLLTDTTAYRFPRFLPSVVLLRLNHGRDSRVYSLVANRVYKTQFNMFFQNGEALPDEDTMSVYPTIVGGFPNLFIDLDLAQAPAFLKELRAVQTLDDWNALRNRYGVLRNSARFWATLDWFNEWNFRRRGEQAGYLDLSYYDLLDTTY
ncbi:MAG: fatty acid cis/trans isomerase [Methylocystis sp.]|uniref:fatty acid cis/trans isomerase n=1 Tax=Methylocystis sp. TaxID=1911079 RepID=UPI003DA28F72